MRAMFTSLILGATLLGCGAAEMSFGTDGEEPWVDTDGDGLSDSEEIELGLDPQKSDSDGDGYSDGAKVEDERQRPMAPDGQHDLLRSDAAELYDDCAEGKQRPVLREARRRPDSAER